MYEATLMQARQFAPKIRVNGISISSLMKNTKQSDSHFYKISRQGLIAPSSIQELLDTILYLESINSMTGNVITLDSGRHLLFEDYK